MISRQGRVPMFRRKRQHASCMMLLLGAGVRALVRPGECVINGECESDPERLHGLQDWEGYASHGSGHLPARCHARAADYHLACVNHPDEPVYATWNPIVETDSCTSDGAICSPDGIGDFPGATTARFPAISSDHLPAPSAMASACVVAYTLSEGSSWREPAGENADGRAHGSESDGRAAGKEEDAWSGAGDLWVRAAGRTHVALCPKHIWKAVLLEGRGVAAKDGAAGVDVLDGYQRVYLGDLQVFTTPLALPAPEMVGEKAGEGVNSARGGGGARSEEKVDVASVCAAALDRGLLHGPANLLSVNGVVCPGRAADDVAFEASRDSPGAARHEAAGGVPAESLRRWREEQNGIGGGSRSAAGDSASANAGYADAADAGVRVRPCCRQEIGPWFPRTYARPPDTHLNWTACLSPCPWTCALHDLQRQGPLSGWRMGLCACPQEGFLDEKPDTREREESGERAQRGGARGTKEAADRLMHDGEATMYRVAELVSARQRGAMLRFSAEAFQDRHAEGCREAGVFGGVDGGGGGFAWMAQWIQSAMAMCVDGVRVQHGLFGSSRESVMCAVRGSYPTSSMQRAQDGYEWSWEALAISSQMRCLEASADRMNESAEHSAAQDGGSAPGSMRGHVQMWYQFDPWMLDGAARAVSETLPDMAAARDGSWHESLMDAGDEVEEVVRGGWRTAAALPRPGGREGSGSSFGGVAGAQRGGREASRSEAGSHAPRLRVRMLRYLRMLRGAGAAVVVANRDLPEAVITLLAGPASKVVWVDTRGIGVIQSDHSTAPPAPPNPATAEHAELVMKQAACSAIQALPRDAAAAWAYLRCDSVADRAGGSAHTTAPGSQGAAGRPGAADSRGGKQEEPIVSMDAAAGHEAPDVGFDSKHGDSRGPWGWGAGKAEVPLVLMCVGVPWDVVLQSMLHAALGGGGHSTGDILTLDISIIASTLGQTRSGYSPEGRIQLPITGHIIKGEFPRADPIDHPTLLRHFAHALHTSRHVAVLVTTALVPQSTQAQDRFSRRSLYIEMFAGLAAAGYPRPLVVEAIHGYTGGRSDLLDDRAERVLYTRVNDMRNQGINEFRSVQEALVEFDLARSDRVVIKHTGRYTFVDTLLLDMAEANADVDVIVRLDDTGRAMFSGTFAMRGSLLARAIHALDLVDIESQSINIETALWQAVVQLCNPEAWPLLVGAEFPPLTDCRVIYLDRLGVRARYESGGERIW